MSNDAYNTPVTGAPAQPYPYNPQAPYGQPGQLAPVLSVGSYIGMFILSAIPLVGFILLLVWAFSGGENPNRKNYARAVLIISVVGTTLGILLAALTGGALFALLGDVGQYYYY